MLEHTDRSNLVEAAFDERIVAQLDRHLVLKTEPGNLFRGVSELLLGLSYTMGADAIVRGSVTDEGAPAAADVEQGVGWLQPQFAADHVEFVGLRGRKIVIPVREIGA